MSRRDRVRTRPPRRRSIMRILNRLPSPIRYLFRSFDGIESPFERTLLAFAKVNLLWSPLVTAFFCLFLEGLGEFWRAWALSMVISAVIGSGCVWGSFAVDRIDAAIFRRFGAPHPGRGRVWSFGVATLLMPVFMFPAFDLAAKAAPWIGAEFRRPSWAVAKTSID